MKMNIRIVEFSAKLWRRTAFLRSGIGLVVIVVVFVGLRLAWVQLQRPAHEREIRDAFGAVSLFYGAMQFSQAGSEFIYTATSDQGYGLFLCDAATGEKHLVHEEHVLGPWHSAFAFYAWPWSPDDSAFVYALHDKLIMQPVDTKKAPAELATDYNGVSDLIWLNSKEIAYVSSNNLCCAERQSDGQWEPREVMQGNGISSLTAVDSKTFAYVSDTNLWCAEMQSNGQWHGRELLQGNDISSLTAVDSNTIAWLQDNLICRLNLTADADGTSNLMTALSSDSNNSPPTDGLKLWLDASMLRQGDQTPVLGLQDLSSSVNDAVANGTPPTYNGPESPLALNGKATIHFSSANSAGLKSRLNLGISGKAPRTIFAVMRHDAGGAMQIDIGDYAARFGYFGLEVEDRFLYLPRLWNRWANRVVTRSPSWNILTVAYDGSNQSAYIDGVLRGTNNVRVDTVDKPIEIGWRSPGLNGTNAAGADGDFAELLVYDRALDAGDRQQVEDYLKTKWFGNKVLSAKSPLVWLNPQMEGLTGFSYSKASGQFLLVKSENGKESLWRYDPQAGPPTQIDTADSIQNPQWMGKNGYAYVAFNSGRGDVMVVDASNEQKTSLSANGDVRWLQAGMEGQKLLMVATFNNEPAAGIWQYDIASRQLHPVVSYSDYPSIYAQDIVPHIIAVKLQSGQSVNCTIYSPPNLNPHKKYPLLIGYTHPGTVINGGFGRLGLPAVAECGAFVVVVNRASWDDGIEQWEDMVTGVRKGLEKNRNIDFNQVFVFAASKETYYLSECVAKSPELWKGIILLDPTGLPDFSRSPRLQERPQILISAGGEEHEEDRLKKYQEESLRSGVLVDVVISSGENHFFVGNAGQLDRARAMIHFIFDE